MIKFALLHICDLNKQCSATRETLDIVLSKYCNKWTLTSTILHNFKLCAETALNIAMLMIYIENFLSSGKVDPHAVFHQSISKKSHSTF